MTVVTYPKAKLVHPGYCVAGQGCTDVFPDDEPRIKDSLSSDSSHGDGGEGETKSAGGDGGAGANGGGGSGDGGGGGGAEPMDVVESSEGDAAAAAAITYPGGSAFAPAVPEGGFNFVTECFFLTARGLNLGLVPATDRLKNMFRNLEHWARTHEGPDLWGNAQFSSTFANIMMLYSQLGDPALLSKVGGGG